LKRGSGRHVPAEDPDPRREVNPVLKLLGLSQLLDAVGRKEEGQTMAEYAVVLAVITVATVAVFIALSGGISGALHNTIGLI
jgi:Flp pilus assembly pilin Flp